MDSKWKSMEQTASCAESCYRLPVGRFQDIGKGASRLVFEIKPQSNAFGFVVFNRLP
ncbi:MAG: hypothetical protein AB1656_10460 [Candidatus Omnitrophota bacterium]